MDDILRDLQDVAAENEPQTFDQLAASLKDLTDSVYSGGNSSRSASASTDSQNQIRNQEIDQMLASLGTNRA